MPQSSTSLHPRTLAIHGGKPRWSSIVSSAISTSMPSDVLGQSEDETDARTARLELSVAELRASAFSDGSMERRARADELRKKYMVQLGQLRQASGVEDDDVDDDSEADDDEELIYPKASVITRLAPSSGLQTPNGPLLRACDPRPRRLLCVRLWAET
ncbi:unnamed protein product [Tilletia controversa]|nr:unnamed protein product [Tilletia controversa]